MKKKPLKAFFTKKKSNLIFFCKLNPIPFSGGATVNRDRGLKEDRKVTLMHLKITPENENRFHLAKKIKGLFIIFLYSVFSFQFSVFLKTRNQK